MQAGDLSAAAASGAGGAEDASAGTPGLPPPGAVDGWWSASTARWADRAFVAVIAIAAVALPITLRDQWFSYDEWAFLAGRDLGRGEDWVESHNGHWVTGPVIAFRALWEVVGLRHYWPYQLLSIGSHLAVAWCIHRFSRRAGAHPWVATVAAALFVVFGSGRENIVIGFQVAFVGGLLLGMVHLLLADHDGPFDRRDAAGVAVGLASLAFGGLSLPLLVAVAVAVLLRRGWRMALVHTVPLVVVYGLWSAAYGDGGGRDRAPAGQVGSFALRMVHASIEDIGWISGVGVALAVLATVGLAIGALGRDRAELRRWIAVLALLVGAATTAVLIAVSRSGFGVLPPGTERYTHAMAALLLPALALGVSEAGRRWRPALGVGLVLLAVGIPGNARALHRDPPAAFVVGSRPLVLSVAELATASDADPSLHPLPSDAPDITIGWLQEGRTSGRIPDPPVGAAAEVGRAAELHLAVMEEPSVEGTDCRTIAPNEIVQVARGDTLRVDSGYVGVQQVGLVGVVAEARFYSPGRIRLGVWEGPLTIRLAPPVTAELCS